MARALGTPTSRAQCVPCGRSFVDSKALRSHLLSSPAHDFKCEVCGKRCHSEGGLQQHMLSLGHAPSKCDVCNKSFGSDEALRQHMRDSPAHSTSLKCDLCNKLFGSEEALNQHVRDSPAHAVSLEYDTRDKSQEVLQQRKQSAKANRRQTMENWKQRFFPELHPRVVEAVSDDIDSTWFTERKSDDRIYKTFVMARFECTRCSKTWRSGRVTIVIRGYTGNGYNAEVFNQHCDSCNTLGTMTLDEDSYVERVVYRLKVWAKVPVTPPPFSDKPMPPHKKELCEGCIQGWCQDGSLLVSFTIHS
ncbi:zinc-binding domain-containing protein [Xylaria arbuscula]|nr:zinc-binding domain-containing protein [Xylaria arbuscula]